MPIIAFIVLLWQRRRVLALWREARAAWSSTPRTAGGVRAASSGLVDAGARLGARAWVAVDTPQNAARISSLIARLRRTAADRAGTAGTVPSV